MLICKSLDIKNIDNLSDASEQVVFLVVLSSDSVAKSMMQEVL